MTIEIITLPHQTLRQKARPVATFDDDLQTLIDEMIEKMREAQGVGLAAPQVDVPYRLAVIETLPEYDDDGEAIEGTRDLYVIINPEIVWKSRELIDGVEGCLSIPGYLGEVERHEAIRVRALDRNGRKIRLKLKGWDARIFQHEIDHLDGVLYIDRLTDPDHFWTEEEYYDMLEAAEERDAAEEQQIVGD